MQQQASMQQQDEDEIDLLELVRLLWSHILQIVAVGLAAAVVCYLVCSFALTPRYKASVDLVVNTRQDNATNITNDNITSATNMIDTYAVIIKSNTMLNQVIEQMGLTLSYSDLYNAISVESVNSTQIMEVSITLEDPMLAGNIVKTIAEVAPEMIVEKVEAGSCKVVSDVTIDPNPVYPQTKKYAVVACALGVVATCGVLVVMHLLHNTVVDDEDIDKKLGLPVLGLIPEV